MTLLDHPNMPLKERNIHNLKAEIRRKGLGGKTLIQALANELRATKNWFSQFRLGPTNKVTGLFFSHHHSQVLLKKYSEVLIIDSTYKTNRFNLLLFDIVGINCKQRTFFVAFCFLEGERYKDFKWALARLVNIYNFWITHPLEIVITDQIYRPYSCN